MGYTHLRLYDRSKSPVGFLPDHQALQTQFTLNDTGTITFQYPKNGINADALLGLDMGYIEVVENGQASVDWFLLEDDGDEIGVALDSAPIRVSGRGVMAMLEWAEVYPELHQPGGPVNLLYPQNRFINETPGSIMATLMARAQARGALAELSYNFTADHDSAGQPWANKYTQQYDSGIDYYTVFTGMLAAGWADGRTNGFVLEMFNPDTVLRQDKPGVIMRRGQSVLQGPTRQRSRRNVRTVILGVGADRVLAEATDGTAIAKWGRREGSANDSRAISFGTMEWVTQAALKEVKDEARAYTLRVSMSEPPGEQWPMPVRDFVVGDLIRYDQVRLDPTTLEPLRVRTITYGWDDSTSDRTCTVELNDRFTEYALVLKARVETLLNGISLAPFAARPLAPLPSPTPPSYPADVLAILGVTDGPGGVKLNAATVTWPEVPVKADGLPYNDHAYYLVSYKQDSVADATGTWSPEQQVSGTSTTFTNLTPGKPYVFRVRAVDLSGNQGAWTYSTIAIGSASAAPPPVPATPVITTNTGVMRVAWSGRDATGAPMPPDLLEVEVQVATAAAGPWTTFDTVTAGPSVSIYVPPNYGTTYYFQLVAHNYGVDTVNSAVASATAAAITGGEVAAKVLGYNNFAFSDAGNLLGDGSFETAAGRAAITLPTGASFANDTAGAFVGNWVLRSAPGSRTIVLASIACTPGQEYLVRRAVKGTGGANGVFQTLVRYYDKAGTLLSQVTALPTATSDGTWQQQFTGPGVVSVPTSAVRMDVCVDSDASFNAGVWDLDACEVRLKIDTLLVRNAAITNALIADATIDKAKIASVNAGSIVSGKVSADLGLAGRLLIGALNADGTLTNPTKKRIELSAGGGIVQYDDTNTPQVSITPSGSTFSGTVQAALIQTAPANATTARLVIDPATLSNPSSVPGYTAGDPAAMVIYAAPVTGQSPMDIYPAVISVSNGYELLQSGRYKVSSILSLSSGTATPSPGGTGVLGSTTACTLTLNPPALYDANRPYLDGARANVVHHVFANNGSGYLVAKGLDNASGTGGRLVMRGETGTNTPNTISFDLFSGAVRVWVGDTLKGTMTIT